MDRMARAIVKESGKDVDMPDQEEIVDGSGVGDDELTHQSPRLLRNSRKTERAPRRQAFTSSFVVWRRGVAPFALLRS
jgi:hypothetical protein